MYRRPKFLEKLLEVRCEMAAEADYDVELFLETARSGGRRPEPKLVSSSSSVKTQQSEDADNSSAAKAGERGVRKT